MAIGNICRNDNHFELKDVTAGAGDLQTEQVKELLLTVNPPP